jgi:hypothetical protein
LLLVVALAQLVVVALVVCVQLLQQPVVVEL